VGHLQTNQNRINNVGGLPETMKMQVGGNLLRLLFKDEVRRVGDALGLEHNIFAPSSLFPGPGLGIRILGDVTEEKVRILQEG